MSNCTSYYVPDYLYFDDDLAWLRVFLPVITHLLVVVPLSMFATRWNEYFFEFLYVLLTMAVSIGYHFTSGLAQQEPYYNREVFAWSDNVLAAGIFVLAPGLILFPHSTTSRLKVTFVLMDLHIFTSYFVFYVVSVFCVVVAVLALYVSPVRMRVWPDAVVLLVLAIIGGTFFFLTNGRWGFLYHSLWHLVGSCILFAAITIIDRRYMALTPQEKEAIGNYRLFSVFYRQDIGSDKARKGLRLQQLF